MMKAKRNIGLEILEGIREIKRGEYGRVTTVPSVQRIREKTGLSQSQFAQLLVVDREADDVHAHVDTRIHQLGHRRAGISVAGVLPIGDE